MRRSAPSLRPGLQLAALAWLAFSADPAEARGAPDPWGMIGAAEPLTGIGTEPFWEVRLHRGFLKFTTPDNQAGAFARVRRVSTRQRLTFRGTLRQHGRFTVTVRRDPKCSDGMSDRTYPFELTLRFSRTSFTGCAWTARHPYSKLEGE